MNVATPPKRLTDPIEVSIALKTRSEMNNREHWRFTAKRAREQRGTTAIVMQPYAFRLKGYFPLLVTFTRISPGSGLDAHDNLPSSMKHVCDGLCDVLGISDRDPRIAFRYDQRRGKRGEYGVEIRLERSDPAWTAMLPNVGGAT